MKNKKAAMEMSVGTIVTIVLLMTVLILGLVLVRTIFTGSIENINTIDQSVKNEIGKLFSEDNNKPIVVYPASRLISIKKGNEDYQGFALALRNTDNDNQRTLIYTITPVGDFPTGAGDWIKAGKTNAPAGETLQARAIMDEPDFVRFLVPDNVPVGLVRYKIEVTVNGAVMSTLTVDLNVKPN